MSRRTPSGAGGSLLDSFVMDLKRELPAAQGPALVVAPSMPYLQFIREAWPIIEPGRPFINNWHIGAIAEHLEAVARFEILNLLINMPPRHMKSIAVSACFTPWVWTWAPIYRFFYSSYDGKLSRRDNQKARDIIESPWYQKQWGDRVTLKKDQNEKDKFENTWSGYRFATSAAGRTTGEGGDFVVCDDPHNVKDVSRDSDVKRQGVLDWWDNAIPSRVNDPKRGAFIIVAQRVHQQDLSGHVLEKDGWVHLCLPAEYEGRKYWTPLGFQDPRSEPGELLWPERYGPEEIAKIKTKMTPREYAGQYQQRPAPAGGTIFQWEWLKVFTELPRFERKVIFWDTAQSTASTAARSCAQLWGEAHNGYYLLDLFKQRLDYPDLKDMAIRLWREWGADLVVVENKSSGISVLQDLAKTTKVPVEVYNLPGGDKVARAKAQAATVRGGNVWRPADAPWMEEFKDELITFPGSTYKDQVDVFTEALDWFQRGSSLTQGLDMS